MRRRPIISSSRRMQLLTVWLVVSAIWSAGVLVLASYNETWTSTQIFGLLALPPAVLLIGIADWLIALRDMRLDRR